MAAAAGAGLRMAKESMVVPEVGVQDIEQYPTSSLDKEINIYKRMREREKVKQYPTSSLDKEINIYKRIRERERKSSSIQPRP